MAIYKRFENTVGEENTWRYTKDNKITNSARVPAEVKERLEIAPSMEYELNYDKPMCCFCDASVTRKRMVNLETVGLCEWHYQHMNLGKIAQQVRENKLKKEKEDGEQRQRKELKRGKRKRSSRQTHTTSGAIGQ